MGSYQSGQMGQTVNLLAMPSVVRIHHYPLFPKITQKFKSPTFEREPDFFFLIYPHNFSNKRALGTLQPKDCKVIIIYS